MAVGSPPSRDSANFAERHREVLEAALDLMAEQGYHGASLRKLARRLGIQQPSLYHYFSSKEELVEQMIETFSADMFTTRPTSIPTRLIDMPQFVSDLIFHLYATHPTHAQFTRVVYAVSRIKPRFGALLREIIIERGQAATRMMVAPFVARGEISEREIMYIGRILTNAISLRLMEEKVLFDERELSKDVYDFAAFAVDLAEREIRRIRAERGFTSD